VTVSKYIALSGAGRGSVILVGGKKSIVPNEISLPLISGRVEAVFFSPHYRFGLFSYACGTPQNICPRHALVVGNPLPTR
jgi:hypothetical protein